LDDAGLRARQRELRCSSITAITMSSTQRLRNEFMTFSQNLAPSF
jgi:hypothetical protein